MKLTGHWISEIGNEINLKVDDNGLISGVFKSGSQESFDVMGLTSATEGKSEIDFAVSWNPPVKEELTEPLCSGFTGRFKIKENEEILETKYLITAPKKGSSFDKDIFKRAM